MCVYAWGCVYHGVCVCMHEVEYIGVHGGVTSVCMHGMGVCVCA